MTTSLPSPVVLRQARGKIHGLLDASAINGTFLRETKELPSSTHLSVYFSAHQEVEDSKTLERFLEHYEDPFPSHIVIR